MLKSYYFGIPQPKNRPTLPGAFGLQDSYFMFHADNFPRPQNLLLNVPQGQFIGVFSLSTYSIFFLGSLIATLQIKILAADER